MASRSSFHSLTRITLYHIAVGVTVIVALSSAVTYYLMFREIEQHTLERLRDYAEMRSAIQMEDLLLSIQKSEIPGTVHTVFRPDGRLVADPDYLPNVIENQRDIRIADIQDLRLAYLLKTANSSETFPTFGYDRANDFYYAISRLDSPGWYVSSTLSGQMVRAQAFRSAQWVLIAGLGSLGLLMLILAAILRSQIGRPLNTLMTAIQSFSAGETYVVEMSSNSDEIGHLAASFNDMVQKISERDAALRVEKERNRALIEHAEDIISVVDSNLVIRYISPSVILVLGHAPKQYLGKTITEVVHQDDAGALKLALINALPDLPIERLEYRIQHKDGEWRVFEATGANQLDNSAVRGIVVNSRDITLAKQAEQEIVRQREALYQREKLAAMGSLLAGVAHELNNPLSIVVGRAIMLEEDCVDEETQAIVQKIRIAAERCARIVKTFLSMARQHQPHYSPVKIRQVIDSSLDMLAYSLRTSGIHVDYFSESELPEISADADQLHQVFMNLLVNAQQALDNAPEPHLISISTRYDPQRKEVCVEVSDNGAGIPDTILSRIFDPYFTTKPTGVGTGLGLSVSLGIVESHGGTLTVRCPPAGGAIFRVCLPVRDVMTEPVGTVEAVANQSLPARKRFLIVDDETEVSSLMADILGRNQHHIDIAGSGREAICFLEKNSYDAILTDLRMPEMDGPALYSVIQERWPELAERVLFVTGDSLSSHIQDLLDKTQRPVIEKPFIPSEVRTKLAELELLTKKQNPLPEIK